MNKNTNPSTNTSPVSTIPKYSLYIPHSRVYSDVGEDSMTIQSAKDECDIRNILSRARRTGVWTHVNPARPSFEELPSDLDYQASMNLLIEANEAFSMLSAKVRDKFGNDPARLLAAIHDPDQAAQLRELGILRPLPDSKPDPAPSPAS